MDEQIKARIISLKETINYLLERDRQRVAWRELCEYSMDDDVFSGYLIDIENDFRTYQHNTVKTTYTAYYDCPNCGNSYREGENKSGVCSCGTVLVKNLVEDK